MQQTDGWCTTPRASIEPHATAAASAASIAQRPLAIRLATRIFSFFLSSHLSCWLGKLEVRRETGRPKTLSRPGAHLQSRSLGLQGRGDVAGRGAQHDARHHGRQGLPEGHVRERGARRHVAHADRHPVLRRLPGRRVWERSRACVLCRQNCRHVRARCDFEPLPCTRGRIAGSQGSEICTPVRARSQLEVASSDF